MCIYRQGEIWWYEFTVDGKRLRKSSRTTDRGLAELIEAEHRERVEKGLREQPPTLRAMEAERKAGRLQIPAAGSAPPPYITPTMTLKEAGMIWLRDESCGSVLSRKRSNAAWIICRICWISSGTSRSVR